MSPELPDAVAVLLRVVDVLERHGAAYHVGGSWASSIHGVVRQTQDVDLVVDLSPTMLEALATDLGEEFHVDVESGRRAIRDRASFNLIHLDTGIKVDVFVQGEDPYDLEEVARTRPQVLHGSERTVMVSSPEDTVLRKLLWYRMGGEVSDRQWSDVLGVVRTQRGRLDTEYLHRWASQLGIEDLLARALDA